MQLVDQLLAQQFHRKHSNRTKTNCSGRRIDLQPPSVTSFLLPKDKPSNREPDCFSSSNHRGGSLCLLPKPLSVFAVARPSNKSQWFCSKPLWSECLNTFRGRCWVVAFIICMTFNMSTVAFVVVVLTLSQHRSKSWYKMSISPVSVCF